MYILHDDDRAEISLFFACLKNLEKLDAKIRLPSAGWPLNQSVLACESMHKCTTLASVKAGVGLERVE